MIRSLSGLGHHTIIRSYDENRDIGRLCSPCTHCGEGFVTWGIQEGNGFPLVDYLVEFDRPTTLARRFASLRARNGGHDLFLGRLDRAYGAARRFMAELEGELGDSVERIVAAA